MNELIKALEQKELVARQPDPDHGRVVQMLLTPAGETLVSKCDRVVHHLEDRMLQHLPGADREQLRSVLWACIGALEQS
jgi:DNA-binding MarR family transcriptional regulator